MTKYCYVMYISQFEVLDNPPLKDEYHRHHIVPKSQQTEKDERCVYLTPAQHLWAHILYDRAHGTKTATGILNQAFLKRENIHSLNDCLIFNEVDRKNRISSSERRKGTHQSEESNRKRSESHMGKNTWIKGRRHFTDGKTEVLSFECPEGFWEGRLPVSEETRKKQSLAKIGKASWNKGKPSWNKGGKAPWVKCPNKGLLWWTDGKSNKYSLECPGEGWVKGMTKKRKSV